MWDFCWWLIVTLVFAHVVTCRDVHFCGALSSYDYLCTVNGTTLILSARPCLSLTRVVITVARNGKSVVRKTDESIHEIAPINGTDMGYTLELHPHTKGIVFNDRLHAKLQYGKIDGKTLKDAKEIFNVEFLMNPQSCKEALNDSRSEFIKITDDDGFIPKTWCDHSLRLGDFSTLCFKSKVALIMTAVDVCTTPYSTKVVVINPNNHLEIINQYTDSYEKKIIPFRASGTIGGDECGVKLRMFHSHGYAHEKQHVTLTYVCKDTTPVTNVDIIDDSYHTSFGLVCPQSNCTESAYVTQACTTDTIAPGGSTLKMTTKLDIDTCHESTSTAHVTINVEGYTQEYSQVLAWKHNHFTTVDSNENRAPYELGEEKNKIEPTPGFLPVSGGEISLYVNEDSRGYVHVLVLRHYPDYTDALPLVRTTFDHTRMKMCFHRIKKKHEIGGDDAWWKVLVGVLCALVVLGGVAFFIWRWRSNRRYKTNDGGLPYHIELGEDDDFDDNS